MIVSIKKFNVEMELKNNGIELEIRDTQDNFLGDLVVDKSKITWCKGRTKKANGIAISLEDFIKYMESRD